MEEPYVLPSLYATAGTLERPCAFLKAHKRLHCALSSCKRVRADPIGCARGREGWVGGGGDYLNNPDVVYDENAQRFYVSSDAHPHPSDDPNYVSSHFRISYFDKPESFSKFKWTEYDLCSPNMTGFARNHNTGILRNEYGHLVSNGYLTVFYTGAIAGKDTLWSYRIHNYNLALPE